MDAIGGGGANFGKERKTMKCRALFVAIAFAGGAGASEIEDLMKERAAFEVARSVAAHAPAGGPVNTCGASPLPTTPVGPRTTATFQYGSQDVFTATAWRIPCSPTESMVVMTLDPVSLDPFFCNGNLTILQAGGLQTDLFFSNPDPSSIDSLCGDVLQRVTVSIYPRTNFPASFDLDMGFTIDHDGLSAGHQQLTVAPYNPADYGQIPQPGTDSVNVFVRGTTQQFRNCVVQSAGVGGGLQYTASCNNEVSIKAAEFGRFDH